MYVRPENKEQNSAKGTMLYCCSGQLFRFFEIKFFCSVVAIFDLVHDVEAIFTLP